MSTQVNPENSSDEEQSVTVPKILNDTGTNTFFPISNIYDTDNGTKFFRYRLQDFFPSPNFTDTLSETFFL